MNTEEFARYVINNMHRATLSNALNITTKLDTQDHYSFEEFLIAMQVYVKECLNNQKIDSTKCYEILSTISKSLRAYKSQFNYNKIYIIDDFIIELWSVLDRSI